MLKKKFLCCFLALSILLLSGCSDNSQGKDKLSNTIWIFKTDKLRGIEFTDDGYCRNLVIADLGDGTGELIPMPLDKYVFQDNVLTFYSLNNSVSEAEDTELDKYTVKFKRNTMILNSENDEEIYKLKKVNNSSVYEYAKTIGLIVPIQGGA